MHADFVHLRTHSAYSLSEGAIKVDRIAALAEQDRMPAAAITDTSNLFGALEFSQACAARGVQPIIGCQLALTRADLPRAAPDQLVVLARDAEGLGNLRRLSSLSYLESDPAERPQLSLERIAAHASGLFLLTGGGNGPLARLLGEGNAGAAERLLSALSEAFAGNAAVELHRHGLAAQEAVEPGLIALADAARLPLVATNDCMFPKPELYQAHDVLLCIAEQRQVQEQDRRRVTPEHWFKPAVAMRALFADLPDACDNTLAIARRCAAMEETRAPLLPICPKVHAGQTERETLRSMAHAGLDARMRAIGADDATASRYAARLEYELSVIAGMGFDGYFLIVADFIQWARARGIPVGPGRGSGAGSVAAWALTITDLDPLRFGLLFERFLNPERVSMPDFDIDFCQNRRDEVIGYVRQEYGADRVAQIITYGKLQARAAVRDVGRVLGLPYGQVNKVCELIPNNPAKPVTLQQAIDGEARLRQLRDDDEAVARLLDIALQLEGLYRHASTHAAGVVIGDRPLIDLVPLYRDQKSDFLVTQYSMKYVELAGLVKFDFLGLTTLTILRRAVDYLRDIGVAVDLDRLPLDDAATYEMLSRGDAAGVFQFESAGMRDVLRQMRPDRFEDLIAGNALYRPGPMANIPDYCRRKHGEKWSPPHPELQEILAETYGIMVYQEQVMQIAQRLAGYSLGAADLLRRAMGKKIRAEMEKQRETFVGGATGRGIPAAKAEEIFDLMAKFADYGFNKSHACAYALLSYQTAWMKANQPVAFLAACMSLARDSTDKLAALRAETGRLGIALLPPDINRSGADFTLERRQDGSYAIRYALAAVKRVGFTAMQSVVAARGDVAFASVADFAARVDPRQLNRGQLENLIRAGAFDGLDANRAVLFGGAEIILRRAQAEAEQRQSGQVGLFGQQAGPDALVLPAAEPWAPLDQIGFEAEAVGFHLTAHPLDAYAGTLRRLGVLPGNRLAAARDQGRVRLAGTVVAVKERTTQKNTRMAWVRLSDSTASFEVTLFSEVLARVRDLVTPGAMLLVTADVKAEGESLRITAQDVTRLDEAAAGSGGGMRVWVRDTAAVPHIRALLEREPRGMGRGQAGRVVLVLLLDEQRQVEIALPGAYAVTPRLMQAMAVVPGVDRVEDV
jgi:DNA polymerase-3 subunit alpha